MEQVNDIRVEQILQEMIRSDDIKLKTHIVAPAETSSLRALESLLESYGLKTSAQVIRTWLDNYEQYMVSWKRLSRAEIIKAVSSILAAGIQEDLTLHEKLMGSRK